MESHALRCKAWVKSSVSCQTPWKGSGLCDRGIYGRDATTSRRRRTEVDRQRGRHQVEIFASASKEPSRSQRATGATSSSERRERSERCRGRNRCIRLRNRVDDPANLKGVAGHASRAAEFAGEAAGDGEAPQVWVREVGDVEVSQWQRVGTQHGRVCGLDREAQEVDLRRPYPGRERCFPPSATRRCLPSANRHRPPARWGATPAPRSCSCRSPRESGPWAGSGSRARCGNPRPPCRCRPCRTGPTQ